MRPPSDKAIREAVIAWKKADLRRLEYLMRGLMITLPESEWTNRRDEEAKAADVLRLIGTRLLAEKPAKRGKR